MKISRAKLKLIIPDIQILLHTKKLRRQEDENKEENTQAKK